MKLNIFTGGNIGTGMLTYNPSSQSIMALLEVSSFQLELCSHFAPTLAIVTNIFPNHLDRHKTKSAYFAAKKKIFMFQNARQQTLLPLSLLHKIMKHPPLSSCHFFSIKKPTEALYTYLRKNDSIFFVQGSNLFRYQNYSTKFVTPLKTIETTLFFENVLIIFCALHILEFPLSTIADTLQRMRPLEHRMEFVGKTEKFTFLNDSKSTMPFSTLTALNQIKSKPLYLIIGGLSKGVSREHFIKMLKSRITKLYCFGHEAEELSRMAEKYSVPYQKASHLQQIFSLLVNEALEAGIVLFSPSGSSFDLFNNYQERGAYFKKLVGDYIRCSSRKED